MKEHTLIEDCNKAIKKIEINRNKIEEELTFYKYVLNENFDREILNEKAIKLVKMFGSSKIECAKLVSIAGITSLNELVDEIAVKLEFIEEKEHLKIVFPDLLPKRLQYDNNKNLNKQDIRNMYQRSFLEYARKPEKIRFKERVAIIYNFYFESDREIKDYDNFETKVVTDLIASSIIGEDSPRECIILFNYGIGEKSHTEIDIIPERILPEYLK